MYASLNKVSQFLKNKGYTFTVKITIAHAVERNQCHEQGEGNTTLENRIKLINQLINVYGLQIKKTYTPKLYDKHQYFMS